MIFKRFRGKFKGITFLLRVHHFIPVYLFNFIGHISKLSGFIAKHKNIEYSDFYTYKFDYAKRNGLYSYVIQNENIDEIDYIELGVAKGSSFKWWIEKNTNPNSHFYGFDTFTGLPEDWGPFKKGDMSNNNALPDINDNRVNFYQGLFQQSLPEFLKSYRSQKRKVIHLDADLYSSTLFALTSLSPFIQKNDILFFDEFNVPMHEFKAFTEWVSSYYINYEVLGAVNNFYQVAIKII